MKKREKRGGDEGQPIKEDFFFLFLPEKKEQEYSIRAVQKRSRTRTRWKRRTTTYTRIYTVGMECRYESSPRFTLVSLSSDKPPPPLPLLPLLFLLATKRFFFLFCFFFYTSLRHSSSIPTLLITANHRCFTFLSALPLH